MSRLTPAEYALRDVLIELIDVIHELADDVSRLGDASTVELAADPAPTLRLLTRRLYALPEALALDESPEVPRSRQREGS